MNTRSWLYLEMGKLELENTPAAYPAGVVVAPDTAAPPGAGGGSKGVPLAATGPVLTFDELETLLALDHGWVQTDA